ncbi:hypothetical protein AOLI_G00050670 [Acnodon oligacanthus]
MNIFFDNFSFLVVFRRQFKGAFHPKTAVSDLLECLTEHLGPANNCSCSFCCTFEQSDTRERCCPAEEHPPLRMGVMASGWLARRPPLLWTGSGSAAFEAACKNPQPAGVTGPGGAAFPAKASLS